MKEVREMEKLPDGWEKVSIEKDSILISGLRPKGGSLDSGIPSLGGEHITSDGRINFSDENGRYIPKKFFEFMTKGKIKRGDILINKDGANTGKVAILKKDFYPNMAINEHLFILRSREFFDYSYLFYWIFSHLGQKQIKYKITGSAQPGLSSRFTKNFFVLKPPLPEQHKIAVILETVDNSIEKTDAIIEKYKRIKQGLMQDLLTKGIDENGNIRTEKTHKFKDSPLGSIPEEWKVVRLVEVVEKIKNGYVYSFSNIRKEGQAITRIETISEGFINKNKLGYINIELRHIACNYLIKVGDILFSHINSYEHVGKTAIYNGDPSHLIHGMNLLLIRTKKHICNPFFLINFIKKNDVRDRVRNLSGQAVNQVSIKPSELSRFQISLPPISEQHRIVSILSKVDNTIEKEEAYKDKLEKIKQGLLEDLLTGKVRVNHLINEEVNNVS